MKPTPLKNKRKIRILERGEYRDDPRCDCFDRGDVASAVAWLKDELDRITIIGCNIASKEYIKDELIDKAFADCVEEKDE